MHIQNVAGKLRLFIGLTLRVYSWTSNPSRTSPVNLARLHEILPETTFCYRKGEPVETRLVGILRVAEIWAMPALSEAPPEQRIVDVNGGRRR